MKDTLRLSTFTHALTMSFNLLWTLCLLAGAAGADEIPAGTEACEMQSTVLGAGKKDAVEAASAPVTPLTGSAPAPASGRSAPSSRSAQGHADAPVPAGASKQKP